MRLLHLLPAGMFALHVTSYHTFDELSPDFSWTDITATNELQYHNCGGGFQCARLQLPLDWNATADSPVYGDKFKMAIVRAPAQVPVTNPRYGGPIILNFGGPGAAGTSRTAQATDLQTSFDAAYSYGSETYVSDHPDARYFDLIFFDPRGVSNSTPWYTPVNDSLQAATLTTQMSALQLAWPPEYNVGCYHYQHKVKTRVLKPMQVSSTQHDGKAKLKRNKARIVLDHPCDHTAMLTSLQNFDRLWQSTYEASRGNIWHPDTNPNGSKIAQYASTAMVARDLVELAERHGQWREKQARIKRADQKTMHRLRWNRGEEPLLVSMASYGTLLGATLASMQPHRVHRFHLDGVVDAAEYYAGELNSDADSSDAVVEIFFEYCALAGPKRCPMWAGNASIDTQRRLEDIYKDIRLNGPIAVPETSHVDPDNITLSDVKTKLGKLFHSPMMNWPIVAEIIAPLTDRNGTAFAAFKQGKLAKILPVAFDPNSPASAPQISEDWALAMIAGGDTSVRLTQAEFAQAR